MAPKQATLGKFFGKPNGSPSTSQQSKLSFQKPKESSKSDESENLKKEAEEAKAVKEDGIDEDVKMEVKSDSEGSLAGTGASGTHEVDDEDSAIDHGEVQSLPTSPAKRSNTELQADEDDDEPVRKRSRRSERGGKDQPLTKKDSVNIAKEEPPKLKAKASKAGEKAKPKDPPSKAEPSRKPKETAPIQDRHSKDIYGVSRERKSGLIEDVKKNDNEPADETNPEPDDDLMDASEEEDADKAREETQSILKARGNDPYPDWKAGEPVPYAALCTTFALIEMTTKRLAIMAHCTLFLRQVLRLTPQDLLPTVQLMINKIAADYTGIELGIGEHLIMKAIGESTGRSIDVVKADNKSIGDLGLVAIKSRSTQRTLYKPKPLTVRGVLDGLMVIATTSGDGSQAMKVSGIKKLLSAADSANAGKGNKGIDITSDKGGASESKFIIRFLEGKLRLGLAERTVLVSLAHAMVAHEEGKKSSKPPSSDKLSEGTEILKTVYSELPNYAVIIPTMIEHGIFHLREHCMLQPGIPLKPMLAKPTKAITEVLDRFEGKNFTCEYKYDGERAQIHYVAEDTKDQYASDVSQPVKAGNGLSAIFSRNSEDLSKKYPDILSKLHTWIRPGTKSFVLDCETVAWDVVKEKVLPFQKLMTRKKKDVKAEDITVQVCVFAFDMLFYNGEAVVTRSLRERRELLHQAFSEVKGEFSFAQYSDTSDLEEIQHLLDESVKASCEGLMVKMLDTEESGYEPSKRSRNWLKVKKDYLSGIGDTLDLVVVGAYFGKGKRTGVYGAFLLACYNSTKEVYETVCNIGTGFSEEILEVLHTELEEHVIDSPKSFYSHSSVKGNQPDVWFQPRFVWEVKTADLTLSPLYKAGAGEIDPESGDKGISLRFPRFLHQRHDKKPEEATGTEALVEMYKNQEGVKKKKGPAADDDFEY